MARFPGRPKAFGGCREAPRSAADPSAISRTARHVGRPALCGSRLREAPLGDSAARGGREAWVQSKRSVEGTTGPLYHYACALLQRRAIWAAWRARPCLLRGGLLLPTFPAPQAARQRVQTLGGYRSSPHQKNAPASHDEGPRPDHRFDWRPTLMVADLSFRRQPARATGGIGPAPRSRYASRGADSRRGLRYRSCIRPVTSKRTAAVPLAIRTTR